MHDVVHGVVIGVKEGVFHVFFDVPIRVANRSCNTRQVHVDFDFVTTSENLLLRKLCIQNEEQNGEKNLMQKERIQ